jgi:ketosteroid isomerase-like protein
MADTTDPIAAVRHYIDCFNKGDVVAMAATCDVPMSILDGMPPHVWHGPAASQDWYRDVLITGEREGASNYFVGLSEPWHVNVTGDRAYVVVPATMSFTVRGKRVKQSGSVFTVALRKLAAGWRLTAWAWAKGTQFDVINQDNP